MKPQEHIRPRATDLRLAKNREKQSWENQGKPRRSRNCTKHNLIEKLLQDSHKKDILLIYKHQKCLSNPHPSPVSVVITEYLRSVTHTEQKCVWAYNRGWKAKGCGAGIFLVSGEGLGAASAVAETWGGHSLYHHICGNQYRPVRATHTGGH